MTDAGRVAHPERTAGSALPLSARTAFVRRRHLVWGVLAMAAALAGAGCILLALHLARWERVGVETAAEITEASECRDSDDDAPVCRFDLVFRTRDGREIAGTLRRDVELATYIDESRRSLRIRYDRTDPSRVTTDFTSPALPAGVAIGIAVLLGVCLWRATTGRRWLDRLDALASDVAAPRRRMRMVLLRCTAPGGLFAAPWAWIVDTASAETRGLNLPLVRGQELVVPGGEIAVEVVGEPRPRGAVVLLVDGVRLYPRSRAQRYESTQRVRWEPIDHTF
jgi:hypothetical protein